MFLKILERYAGEIVIHKETETPLVVDRDLFSVYLWIGLYGQEVKKQNLLYKQLQEIIDGDVSLLEELDKHYVSFVQQYPNTKAPTDYSVVTAYYRCNVFSSPEEREALSKDPKQYNYFSTNGLLKINQLHCADLEDLPSFGFDITDEIEPISVPILAWMGREICLTLKMQRRT